MDTDEVKAEGGGAGNGKAGPAAKRRGMPYAAVVAGGTASCSLATRLADTQAALLVTTSSLQPAAQEARGMCAKYLEGRIQSVADQKPGRKPDMNPDATAALLSVLHEVSSGQRHLQRRLQEPSTLWLKQQASLPRSAT